MIKENKQRKKKIKKVRKNKRNGRKMVRKKIFKERTSLKK